MKIVTLLLPKAFLEGLDRLVEAGYYPSRSAAIRFAVRDLLRREFWRPEREVAKSPTISKRPIYQRGRY